MSWTETQQQRLDVLCALVGAEAEYVPPADSMPELTAEAKRLLDAARRRQWELLAEARRIMKMLEDAETEIQRLRHEHWELGAGCHCGVSHG